MNDYNTIFNPTNLHLEKPIDNNGLRRKNIDLIVEDLSKLVKGGPSRTLVGRHPSHHLFFV
jgi:hypothetical protein